MPKHIGIIPQYIVIGAAERGVQALIAGRVAEGATYLLQAASDAVRAVHGEGALALLGYQMVMGLKATLMATGMLDDGRLLEELQEFTRDFSDDDMSDRAGYPNADALINSIVDFFETPWGDLGAISFLITEMEKQGRIHDEHTEDPE